MIIDTHAHYDDEQFDEDREEILGKMQDAGIGMIMDAGSTILSWDKIVKLTEEYPFVYGAIGVHPDEVGNLDETQFARMERLLDKEKIKAVGEIGLDYYWDKENHDLQKEWFIRQLDLARKKEKPVIIHSREAAADTMEIMKEYASGLRGVIHCYSYSAEMAKEYVKMGYYIGIGGVVREVIYEIGGGIKGGRSFKFQHVILNGCNRTLRLFHIEESETVRFTFRMWRKRSRP